MSVTIIIDGYNLLRRGFGFGSFDLESQRAMMETQLEEFLRLRPGAQILLIYDGQEERRRDALTGRPGRASERLTVTFSVAPRTADDVVLQECQRRHQREAVLVVTSDRKDIVKRLPTRNVRHVNSEDFVSYIEEAVEGSGRAFFALQQSGEPAAPGPGEREKPEGLAPEEVREWLQIFGEEDAATSEDLLAAMSRETAESAETEESEDKTGPAPSQREDAAKLSEDEIRDWLRYFGEEEEST